MGGGGSAALLKVHFNECELRCIKLLNMYDLYEDLNPFRKAQLWHASAVKLALY